MLNYRPTFIEHTNNGIQRSRGDRHARSCYGSIQETARLKHYRLLTNCGSSTSSTIDGQDNASTNEA